MCSSSPDGRWELGEIWLVLPSGDRADGLETRFGGDALFELRACAGENRFDDLQVIAIEEC